MSEQSTLNYFVHEQKKRKCVFWMKKYKENVQENCPTEQKPTTFGNRR